eukprot:4520327-Pyramimonas_sp.AAC.1
MRSLVIGNTLADEFAGFAAEKARLPLLPCLLLLRPFNLVTVWQTTRGNALDVLARHLPTL